MTRLFIILSSLIFTFSGAIAWAQDKPIRIYISADMEGLAGVVQPLQTSTSGLEYRKYREVMTNEVLAAIEGAKEAGATEFVVADSHGGMQNLLIDKFPEDVKIIRGSPRPLLMMEGVQNGHFDGAIFIGYHSSGANPKGVRAHTISGGSMSDVNINGLSATEGYINAGIAGEFDVPIIMISGDEAATKEVRDTVGDMEVAVVKQSIAMGAAETMTPKAAQKLIKEKARIAVGRIKDFKPFKLEGTKTLQVSTMYYRPAEILAYLPIVERAGSRTIEYKAENFIELSKFLAFMTYYSLSLKP